MSLTVLGDDERHNLPPIIFARMLGQSMLYKFAADSCHTKKLCSRLFSSEVRFYTENGRFALDFRIFCCVRKLHEARFRTFHTPVNLGKKSKIRAITAFKVIQDHRGRYQSKARIRFPITRWHGSARVF